MRVKSKSHWSVTLVALGASVAGCSLEAPHREGPSLYVDLSSITDEFAAKSAPGTIGGFDCLGINVVGPGIPDSSGRMLGNLGEIHQALLQQAYCSYRGVTAGPILKSGSNYVASELALSVPAGPARVIQVMGIVDARAGRPACQPGTFATDLGATAGQVGFYEIARAVVDLASDRAISLASAWDGTEARLMNCTQGGPPPLTVSVTSPIPGVTNTMSWTVTGSVTGAYDEYCWQENDTSVANCSWATGVFPTSVSVGGGDGVKILSFWVRNTATGVTSPRFDMTPITLDTTAPVVTVLHPNGGEVLSTASDSITWTWSDAGGPDPAGATFEYSPDGGSTWTLIATGQPVNGAYSWTLPNITSSTVRVRITVMDLAGNSAMDSSDTNFDINNP